MLGSVIMDVGIPGTFKVEDLALGSKLYATRITECKKYASQS